MKKIYLLVLGIIFSFIFLTTGCAKRGSISGGPKDTIPPSITSSFPKNYSTNFDGKEIKISFNELIKVKNINKQLIISPPLKKQPIIIPQGSASRFISIKILDTLQENTTYSFNFGQSITDNNEGNPYSQYKYVFSTGSYIDSLTVVGTLKDAYEQKPDNFVSVQLYDAATFNDSTVYKETPLYVTNTLDSIKAFALENLKQGSYYIVALKDKNSNYKFDPKSDKIGFLKDKITIPTDTVYELELFKEIPPFKVEKPTQESNNKFFMAYQGDVKKTKITAQQNNQEYPIRITKFPITGKDSIQLFIPKISNDSIALTVENGDYTKTFKSKIKELKETDSLTLDAKQKGVLAFRELFTVKTSLPLDKINNKFITLFTKDSTTVSFETKYNEFEQEILFDFKKKENESYKITLLPGAIEDMYQNTNDTLTFNFKTKELADYGNLNVTLKAAKRFPLILEVLNPKGEVVANAVSNGDTLLKFETIEPNTYTLRIIYDDNNNGIWDTGNYLEKRQAEEIQYYPKQVDVRANWDVNQDFD
ncbi:Ig-like domain-containing protein [Flavobacterium chuncheonense]|uniref:Ig-like domain-containing protein n=1 Tax=Flavobacterium chuncheonense TaxID=2026653 RepID=A0ABW5YLV8_9FLAO